MTPMFIPGPVDVPPEVLAAQARPMLPHRSREFQAVFQRVEEKARKLFHPQQPVFLVTASGSGMQEAAMRNFIAQDVLCCANGAFSQRWFDIAVSNGKKAEMLAVEYGQVISPEMLADALKKNHYEAVAIVHNETSTGAENPLEELCAAARETSPDTLVLVDAVSSLGGVKIEMEAWGIDFLFTASQQCLALPPGLSLAAASERAMKKAETVANRGWYFDLLLMEKHRLKDSTPMTPAMALIFALDVQLDCILEEGLENRFARHAVMAGRVQKWAEEQDMPPLAPIGGRSKTVTSLINTRGFAVADLNKFLLARGMRVANGYGPLKEKNFRIAHMGETQLDDIEALLVTIEEFCS
ncbi:MAG: alanine--glyoxylate aminotransferase family protein [Anaerolineaceae bacterium]|nr:alanine--glyoxylate aminotransferase family protein [Anaerolineaceae bacterium]